VASLREGILEAYTGVVGTYKQTEKSPILLPYVASIFAFLHLALTDPDRTEGIVRSAVGLIGDLASEYPKGEIREVLISDWVAEAIKSARTRVGNQDTKNVAKWAKEMVRIAVTQK